MKNSQDKLLILITVLLTLIGSGWSRDPYILYSEIIYQDNSTRINNCEFNYSTFHLICFGGIDEEWKNGSDLVKILTLSKLNEEKSIDPFTIMAKFPVLESLSILDSNFTRLDTPFPSSAKYLREITFNGTKLNEIPKNAFLMLPALTILDLRNNDLSLIDSTSLAAPSIEEVYLAGNSWKCVNQMSWILNLTSDPVARRIKDRDKLTCTFLSYGRPLVMVMEASEELIEQCLRIDRCTCELSWVHVERSPGVVKWESAFFVTVNCSSKNFTQFPEFLPRNTSTLYLSNNQIRDLTPLKTNPHYKRLQDVYLDGNEIESITVLEGSDWLDQFRALDLRKNRLTDIPSYALENALQQNHNAASVFLGKNPWQCDCHFIPAFQDLLARHKYIIKDARDITCSKIEGDANSGKQILYLTRTSICALPADWIQPLDVLNVVLASLIFFVFGKLLYDYWNFRRTGKLPWIVMKIP